MNVQKELFYCTIPSVGVGGGINGYIGVSKMLKFYFKIFI